MGIHTKKGINAQRNLLNPSHGIDAELRDLRTGGVTNTLLRAVVVEVLNDLETLDKAQIESLASNLNNAVLLNDIPRNSIIARIVSNGQDRRSGVPIICYPFLPPYLALPVKPGEQVWIMFENSANKNVAHWMWRCTSQESVDDLCYTHFDRQFDVDDVLTTSQKASNASPKTLGFPNGGGTETTWTLSGEKDFENIVNNSKSYKNVTLEPVPRYRKRPGDAVLQGSNNTLIVLGEDRQDGPTKLDKDQAGTIDIVAGRSRFMPKSEAEIATGKNPDVVKNDRGYLEVEKRNNRGTKKINFSEGDPDLINDASRLYVSQKTSADKNFQLDRSQHISFTTPIPSIEEQPYAVLKSDNVRLIARKDQTKNIQGTIRIVKEGTFNDDLAGIDIHSDGTIHIYGKEIYLGNNTGLGAGAGSAGSEPFIKYSVQHKWLEDVIDKFVSFLTQMEINFSPGPNATPGYGAPNPGLVTMVSHATTLKAELEVLKQKIPESQSKRIFGE